MAREKPEERVPDLEVARDQLSFLLAQMRVGRVTLCQLEEARVAENDKWMAFYGAQYNAGRARSSLPRLSDDMLAALALRP